MKILALYHTLWAEMMIRNWKELEAIEIIDLPVPVVDWEQKPDLKKKVVRLICDMAELQKVDLIVDINGAAIQPLDEKFRNWTVNVTGVRWCEWWWDDPVASVPLSVSEEYKAGWLSSVKSPNVTHFFWDKTLAEEYSVWFGKKCHYLPTAVHPGAFSPESAALSKRKFPETDLSFLGTYYKETSAGNEPEEVAAISGKRLANPTLSYFDIAYGADKEKIPHFHKAISDARSGEGFFDTAMRSWRHWINCSVGYERRNRKLDEIIESGASSYFCGFNFPPYFKADSRPVYQPLELSALYSVSVLNLNFNSGQSFSGLPMRCYEIMSSCGLLALPERPDFDADGLLESKLYFRYSSHDELMDILKLCRSDSAMTAAMRQNAREYAASNHSWLHRFPLILQQCFSS